MFARNQQHAEKQGKEMLLVLTFAFSFHHVDMNTVWQIDNSFQIAQAVSPTQLSPCACTRVETHGDKSTSG